jgi:tetratricopeptide (TPR) repeat protein
MNVILSLILLVSLSGADALMEEGRTDEARAVYEELLAAAEDAGERAVLLDRIGSTLLYEGRLWEAESRYTESIEAQETAAARLHRGQVHFYAGQESAMSGTALGTEVLSLMNDAVRELTRALELEPGLAEAHEYVGYCERYRRNAEAEEAAYRRALESEPGRPGPSLYLAHILEARGETAAALQLLAAVPAESRNADLLLLMGRLAGASGDKELERSAYLKAVVSAPEDPAVYQALWDATGFQKRFNVFNAAMREVLHQRPDAALAHYYLGFSHQYAKRPEEAIAAFRRTLELNPEEHRARLMIAEILRTDLRDDAAARAEYLAVLQADPENARAREVLAGMGFVAARDGDLDTAELVFGALRDAEPTQWVHQANLALIMKERNRPEDALRIYEAAEERFPFEAQIPNDRGLLLMGLGRTEEAFAAFHAALERDSEFLDALENLGAYSLLSGDAEAAVGYFRRAYERVRSEGGDASKFRRYMDLAARERDSR